MNSKPLTYDSLKTILLYMDPNTRIILSSRISSIRVAERAVPLEIRELKVGSYFIKVNETVFDYGIYQVDCKDESGHQVSIYSPLTNRLNCDVDEFGIRVYIAKAGGMLPGNNGFHEKNLFGEYDLEIIPTNEGRLEKLKRRLNVEKEKCNQLLNHRPNDNLNNTENCIKGFTGILHAQIYKKEELELLKNKEMVEKAIKYTNKKIKQMEDELLPFENKRKNIRPKFEIRVTKRHMNITPCVIERVKYTGDLHKAGDSLMEFMFAKRQHAIQINELLFLSRCHMLQVLPNMKMMIQHLELRTNVSSMVKILKPIMDESSFPCEKLKIFYGLDERQELDEEFIKHFKVLIIEGAIDLTLPLVQNLQNQKVNFKIRSDLFFQSPDFIDFIRNWVDINKPIGTCFIFYCYQEESDFIQILNSVRDQIEGAIAGNKSVNIPIRNSTVLQVSYDDNQNEFFIKMAVVPIK
uniref:S-adenosyl-L-methionine-dependent methyltransferase n=1 Tax=Caenorhabditis tropicalis TaxID=1561998 RepID=A0A1I7TAK6_9PELO